MCDNAFEWARARGKLRENEIHKAQEADLPYDDMWVKTDETGTRIEFESGFELDAPCQNACIYVEHDMHVHAFVYVYNDIEL